MKAMMLFAALLALQSKNPHDGFVKRAAADAPIPAPTAPEGGSVLDAKLPFRVKVFHPATPAEMSVIARVIVKGWYQADPPFPTIPNSYSVAYFDLDGDGKSEMFVESHGATFCQPKCDVGIMVRAKKDWRLIWEPMFEPTIVWKRPPGEKFAVLQTPPLDPKVPGLWYSGTVENGRYTAVSIMSRAEYLKRKLRYGRAH